MMMQALSMVLPAARGRALELKQVPKLPDVKIPGTSFSTKTGVEDGLVYARGRVLQGSEEALVSSTILCPIFQCLEPEQVLFTQRM